MFTKIRALYGRTVSVREERNNSVPKEKRRKKLFYKMQNTENSETDVSRQPNVID